ncbi:MAG: hypothetical protein JRI26_13345 [Deltaproteobacteria bacterium]|nr:hypothetical protein [Deltaproteobacteria bacterium]
MKIIAIDPGLSTGWAVWFSNVGRIESGVQTFKTRRGESPGMRYLYFRTWLDRMLNRIRPDLIIYEMSHLRGGAATQIQVGLTSRIEETCSILKTDYMKVNSTAIKKFITGSGRASKEEMIKAANELFKNQKRSPGREITSDDEADAVCILAWAVNEFETEGEK